MNLIALLYAFFMHLRAVTEAASIILFGYIIPIIESLALTKPQRQNEEISDTRLKKVLGLWTGVVLLEAILVPGSYYWGQDYQKANVGLTRACLLAVISLDLFDSRLKLLRGLSFLLQTAKELLKS